MDGVSHTIEVTAATLREAVARGLAAIRGNEWVAGIAHGFNAVKVSVADGRVEHEVKLGEFYDLLVEEAKKILLGRRASFDRLARMLKCKLLCSNDELTMEMLPVGKMGAFVLNQSDLAL